MKIFKFIVAISVSATVAQAQQQYTVQPGDSLGQIATQELGDSGAWRDLCEINLLANCDKILVGQVLQLPPIQTLAPKADEVSSAEAGPSRRSTTEETLLLAQPVNSAQNMVPNSRLNGAAEGVIGAGGSLPDGWSISGFQRAEIVQKGTETGLPYIDLRLAGAPGGNAIFLNFVTSENSVEVAPGQTWTSSAFVQRVGGDLINIDSIVLRVQEFAGPNGKVSSGTNITNDLDTRTRAAVTKEISDAATDRIISFFRIEVSEGDIDITLRISGLQVEQSDSVGDVQLTGDAG